MRHIAVFATALVFAGCGTKKCKDHTVLVTVDFDHATPGDVSLALSITVGSKAAQSPAGITVPAGKTSTTVEVDFSDAYPAGSAIEVSAVVSDNGNVIGSGDVKGTLGSSCGDLTVPVTLTQSGDHGVDTDGGIDAGEDMSHHDGLTTPPDMTTCPILYVSQMTGSDTANDGCTTTTPVATIGHALAIRVGQKIEVCAGNYTERVTLTSGELLGGFKCSDFSRTNYGYPSFAANVTNIGGNNMDGATITIPATAAAGTTFDGFSVSGYVGIQGEATGEASIGVEVDGPATVSNNNITGGYAYATEDNGSVGLVVTGAADIFNNVIEGGSGSSMKASGSIGLFSNPAGTPPHIHENTVHGGSGSGPIVGSLGMLLSGTGNQTAAAGLGVESNIIDGGTGTSTVTQGVDAIGVWTQGTLNIDLFKNTITGNHGTANGGIPATNNVQALNLNGQSGLMHVYQNAIYGGSGDGALTIVATTSGTVRIESNMLLGGTAVKDGWSDVIEIASDNAFIIHNTLIGAGDTNGGLHPLIQVQPGHKGLIIEDNIFAGSGGGTTSVVQDYTNCLVDEIGSLKNNVAVGTDYLLYTGTGEGGCASLVSGTFTDDVAMQNAFPTKVATGNIRLSATCPTPADGCVLMPNCTSPLSCLSELLTNWVSPPVNDNLAVLTSAVSFSLTSHAPCPVTGTAASGSQAFNFDYFGKQWGTTPSMGAASQTDCGAP